MRVCYIGACLSCMPAPENQLLSHRNQLLTGRRVGKQPHSFKSYPLVYLQQKSVITGMIKAACFFSPVLQTSLFWTHPPSAKDLSHRQSKHHQAVLPCTVGHCLSKFRERYLACGLLLSSLLPCAMLSCPVFVHPTAKGRTCLASKHVCCIIKVIRNYSYGMPSGS